MFAGLATQVQGTEMALKTLDLCNLIVKNKFLLLNALLYN